MSAAYAAKNNLELVEGDYTDLGISAFRGKNIKAGLGRFLAAVRDGKIERDSYLLVESLDRVSRQAPFDAAAIMREIVLEGITVVDLSDLDRVYNLDTLRTKPTKPNTQSPTIIRPLLTKTCSIGCNPD